MIETQLFVELQHHRVGFYTLHGYWLCQSNTVYRLGAGQRHIELPGRIGPTVSEAQCGIAKHGVVVHKRFSAARRADSRLDG